MWDVWQLLKKLEGYKLAPMNDPKGATGRIHPCSSDATLQDALSKLETAAGRARKALDAQQKGADASAFIPRLAIRR